MTSSVGFNLRLDLARIEQNEDRALRDEELSQGEFADLMGQVRTLERRISVNCHGYAVRPDQYGGQLETSPRPGRGDRFRDRDGRDGPGERDGRDGRRSRWER
jgi:hypothetical protein